MNIAKKELLEKLSGIDPLPKGSAWSKGVKQTAIEIVNSVETDYFDNIQVFDDLKMQLLRGAENWNRYTRGACGRIVSDHDICVRFCSPSEAKKKNFGQLQPGPFFSDWMDVYSLGCTQAEHLIHRAFQNI